MLAATINHVAKPPLCSCETFSPLFLLFFIATKKKWMKKEKHLLLGNHGPQQNNYKSCAIDWWSLWVNRLRMLHMALYGGSHTDTSFCAAVLSVLSVSCQYSYSVRLSSGEERTVGGTTLSVQSTHEFRVILLWIVFCFNTMLTVTGTAYYNDWAKGWTVRGSSPGKGKRFIPKTCIPTLGPTHPPPQWLREAWGWPVTSRTEVKNEWMYTSTLPVPRYEVYMYKNAHVLFSFDVYKT